MTRRRCRAPVAAGSVDDVDLALDSFSATCREP